MQEQPRLRKASRLSQGVSHTARYEGIFGPFRAESLLHHPWEPPHVPTVLPTVGHMDYTIAGYSRNPLELGWVEGFSVGGRITNSPASIAREKRKQGNGRTL